MDKDQLDLMREWLRAEIDAKIADAQPGSDGYYGTGYAENKEADRLFAKVCESLTHNAKVRGPEAALSPEAPSRLTGSTAEGGD